MTNTPPGPADWTPDHYRGNGMQPFDVINAFNLDFYEGNVLKYLLRWRRKNGVEDLCKARTYLQVLIDRQPKPEPALELEAQLRALPGVSKDPATVPAIMRAIAARTTKEN
jgi:hypothetical protein